VIGVVLFIDVAILVAWSVIDPLHWERVVIGSDQFGNPLESQGYCTSDHWSVFGGAIAGLHILLLGIACLMCYLARYVESTPNSGYQLALDQVSQIVQYVSMHYLQGHSHQI
jgi:hypothetical protein